MRTPVRDHRSQVAIPGAVRGGAKMDRPDLLSVLGNRETSRAIAAMGTEGAGAPLAADVRTTMERRFGEDLSDVRLHTGPLANDAAAVLGAKAYTLGPHIAFARGSYEPRRERVASLLAHELAHVVQQRGAGAPSAST